jgi:hypothetical protein
MRSSRFALVVGAMALLGGGVAFGAGANRPTLASPNKVKKSFPAFKPKHIEATEMLFRGDMLPDLGLGCSNPTGTAGGPNDWATKVTATLTPPFGITNTTYNIFSFNSGPTWDIVAWANGATPGAELGRTPLGQANGTTGNHTVAVVPFVPVPAGQQTFFFGLSQGADLNGVRIGMDSSGSTPNTVYIRAPGCGLNVFGTVESIGFPGFWVHRITINDVPPVELMNFDVK